VKANCYNTTLAIQEGHKSMKRKRTREHNKGKREREHKEGKRERERSLTYESIQTAGDQPLLNLTDGPRGDVHQVIFAFTKAKPSTK
jgi:hypothetical protein